MLPTKNENEPSLADEKQPESLPQQLQSGLIEIVKILKPDLPEEVSNRVINLVQIFLRSKEDNSPLPSAESLANYRG